MWMLPSKINAPSFWHLGVPCELVVRVDGQVLL